MIYNSIKLNYNKYLILKIDSICEDIRVYNTSNELEIISSVLFVDKYNRFVTIVNISKLEYIYLLCWEVVYL